MDMYHMQCFVTLAKCLSFTEAAKQLYITQPSLSRQISVMEKELNMQLFIRDNKTTRLTPAGEHLIIGFTHVIDEYEKTIQEAGMISRTYTGNLNIGILDLQFTYDSIFSIIRKLKEDNPSILIDIRSMGYKEMEEGMLKGNVDIAVTADFVFENDARFIYKKIAELDNFLVIPVSHPNACKNNLRISDFKDDVFISVVDEETPYITKLLRHSCLLAGFEPKLRFMRSNRDYALAIETGQGIGGVNSGHYLHNCPHLKFVKVPEILNGALVAAWKPENDNPLISKLIRMIPQA